MPCIAKLHLGLGHGGQGAGGKQLADKVAKVRNGGTAEQQVLKLLLQRGPMHIRAISEEGGGAKSRAYGAVHQLRKKGLAEAGADKGVHQLTAKARAQLGGALALPAPEGAQVAHGPAGRAKPGSGNIVLRAALDGGPLAPVDLRKRMSAPGMSPKSVP